MPDEPEILRDLVTPVQPVKPPGNERTRGLREGLVLAVILVFAALGAGVLAVPRLAADASPGASGAALASTFSVSPSPSVVAPTPDLGPTPAVTPQQPCGTDLPDEMLLAKVIAPTRWYGTPLAESWMAQPLPPSPVGDPPGPDVPLGAPVVMSTDLNACALAWAITLNGIPVWVQDNPLHDPAFAAQNYFVLQLPAVRDAYPRLRAELLFSRGWAGYEWTIHFQPPPIPNAFFTSLDQTIDAAPGCGFAITLASGSTAVDECATTIPPDDAGPFELWVPPTTAVAFRVPNETFVPADGAPVRCGKVDGAPPDFHIDAGCVLDPAYDPSSALAFRMPGTPGEWWVEVQGCANRVGSTACGLWFAIINTAEPMPSDTPID